MNVSSFQEFEKGASLTFMNMDEGKNYILVNQHGISYDLINPNLKEEFLVRVFGKFDLLVDGEITMSPKDFWIAMKDLDGEMFVQPIDGSMLAIKLMSSGFVPV